MISLPTGSTLPCPLTSCFPSRSRFSSAGTSTSLLLELTSLKGKLVQSPDARARHLWRFPEAGILVRTAGSLNSPLSGASLNSRYETATAANHIPERCQPQRDKTMSAAFFPGRQAATHPAVFRQTPGLPLQIGVWPAAVAFAFERPPRPTAQTRALPPRVAHFQLPDPSLTKRRPEGQSESYHCADCSSEQECAHVTANCKFCQDKDNSSALDYQVMCGDCAEKMNG